MTRRLGIYFAALLALAIIALLLAYGGLGLCAPAALPGDETWTLRRRALEALTLLARGTQTTCFLGSGPGVVMLWLASHALWLLGALLLALAGWEFVGRALRLSWLRRHGGHSILAGNHRELAQLSRGQRGSALFLAPDAEAEREHLRARPFAEIGRLGSRTESASLLDRFGADRASLVAATTLSDSANRDIAEHLLEQGGASEILVRLEQGSVRAMSSHRLRRLAEQKGRKLAILSLEQLRTRRGMAAAMPGRYTVEGTPRVHIAVCGSGPGLLAVAFELARQGFGLERDVPLLSILRTGTGDFGAGELERLMNSPAVELRLLTAPPSAPGAIDRAIGDIAIGGPPLLAVHCVSDIDGDAEELARRWEAELVANRLPVPPIIAYTREARSLGSSGMIRSAVAPDLAEARELSVLMDARARAVHQKYVDAQRAARGAAFGGNPAEVEWELLSESDRDDNRNVADQMDYKLARIFMAVRKGTESASPPTEGSEPAELLAQIAHARWMASRAVNGWRYGSPRDNRKLLHPDMIPYDQLDEPGKQKDRDEVATLDRLAALSGEVLLSERRVGIDSSLTAALEQLVAKLRVVPATSLPVVVLPLNNIAAARMAASLIGRGIAVEAVIDTTMDDLRHANGVDLPAFADVLRMAWRIHVAPEGAAGDAIKGRTDQVADENGDIHARS
ncbi:MAG: RyR domain-containing protein [Devosia sp.]